jgi:hypothetical protein
MKPAGEGSAKVKVRGTPSYSNLTPELRHTVCSSGSVKTDFMSRTALLRVQRRKSQSRRLHAFLAGAGPAGGLQEHGG